MASSEATTWNSLTSSTLEPQVLPNRLHEGRKEFERYNLTVASPSIVLNPISNGKFIFLHLNHSDTEQAEVTLPNPAESVGSQIEIVFYEVATALKELQITAFSGTKIYGTIMGAMGTTAVVTSSTAALVDGHSCSAGMKDYVVLSTPKAGNSLSLTCDGVAWLIRGVVTGTATAGSASFAVWH